MTISPRQSFLLSGIPWQITSLMEVQILFGNGSDLILKNREYFGPVNIEKLHIMLLDMYGKPYNLSNNDYSFALEFTILYTN